MNNFFIKDKIYKSKDWIEWVDFLERIKIIHKYSKLSDEDKIKYNQGKLKLK